MEPIAAHGSRDTTGEAALIPQVATDPERSAAAGDSLYKRTASDPIADRCAPGKKAEHGIGVRDGRFIQLSTPAHDVLLQRAAGARGQPHSGHRYAAGVDRSEAAAHRLTRG